jgi:hypothetical protein
MNNVFQGIWEEAAVTQRNAISWNLHRETKENHDKLLSGYPVFMIELKVGNPLTNALIPYSDRIQNGV